MPEIKKSEVLVNDHFLILSKNLEIRRPNFGIGQNYYYIIIFFVGKVGKIAKKWPDFKK